MTLIKLPSLLFLANLICNKKQYVFLKIMINNNDFKIVWLK